MHDGQERRMFTKKLYSILGYYEPGNIPTLLQQPDSSFPLGAIAVHELNHRDLIHNTIYGYLLWRSAYLLREPSLPKTKRESLEKNFSVLAGRITVCAEGLATLVELLYSWIADGRATVSSTIGSLPPFYKEAFSHFAALANRWGILPRKEPDAFFNYVNISSIAQAVAEYTLDHQIWHSLQSDSGFLSLQKRVLQFAPPDELLEQKIRLALGIPTERMSAIFLSEGYADPREIKLFVEKGRVYVEEIKKCLLETDSKGARLPLRGWKDKDRVKILNMLELTVENNFPGVSTCKIGDGISFAPLELRFLAPKFNHGATLIAEDDLLESLASMREKDDFAGVAFLVTGARGELVVRTIPFVVRRKGLLRRKMVQMADQHFETLSSTEDLIRVLDRDCLGLGSMWYSLYTPRLSKSRLNPKNIIGSDVLLGVDINRDTNLPVFLFSPWFSWDLVPEVRRRCGEVDEICCWSQGVIEGVGVVTIKCDKVNIISLVTSAYVGKDINMDGLKLQRRELTKSNDFQLAKALIVSESVARTIAGISARS